MTPEKLAELRGLVEKATKGPWLPCAHLRKSPCGCGGNRGFIYAAGVENGPIAEMYHEEDRERDSDLNPHLEGMPLPSREQVLADAALIVALRNAAPELLAAAEREAILRAALGEILNYCDEDCWCKDSVIKDGTATDIIEHAIARKALARSQEVK